MPPQNNFRHQTYETTPPAAPYQLLSAEPPPPPGSAEFSHRMSEVGRQLRAAGVAAIYLIHGTFAGNDALGLVRKFSWLFPFAGRLRAAQRELNNIVLKDGGNYTVQFTEDFSSAINPDGQSAVEVRLFNWSSENNHVARCEGAVQLIDELANRDFDAGNRVLLWGHSHGGNVLALATNLLGADSGKRDEFFEAAAPFYRRTRSDKVDAPVWSEVAELLASDGHPLSRLKLDIATFGTPVRYGWDSSTCDNLLHFVYHRPAELAPEYQAVFPARLDDILSAAHGDFVQQIGIAGSGFTTTPLSWRAHKANRNLRRLLQSEVTGRDVVQRIKKGVRVADDGTTLLVDYQASPDQAVHHLAGHAVYTRRSWMLFHAEEVVRRCYAD